MTGVLAVAVGAVIMVGIINELCGEEGLYQSVNLRVVEASVPGSDDGVAGASSGIVKN